MTEAQATSVVDAWNLDLNVYDTNGCIEDLMDGWDPDDKTLILARNEY